MSDIYYEYQQEQAALLNKYVAAHLSPVHYKEIMDKLKELKAYGNENSYYYGDADVYVHIETIDKKECLVINNVVSCSDRPVCILSIEDNAFPDIGSGMEYAPYTIKAVCTTPTSTTQYDNMFNDRRDYKVVGLDVLKEKGFKYLYGDCRDAEWAFNSTFFLNPTRQLENLNRDNTLFLLSEFSYLYNNLSNLSK